MNITYRDTITVDEVNAIRKSMGWRQFHPDQMQGIIDSAELVIAAYDGEKAVGFATPAGIILINPQYQFIGIEKEFVTRMYDFVHSKLQPGFGEQIHIRAFGEEQITLYESLGFQISTQLGTPMHICVTNQVEITDKMYKQMEFKEDGN
ncbi:MAG: hypothetical protein FWC32_11590 [Firmicutes bacterium]|nr:hypothetical protein [Bacillota bacterium]